MTVIITEMSKVMWLLSNQRLLNDQLFNAAVTTLETPLIDMLPCRSTTISFLFTVRQLINDN